MKVAATKKKKTEDEVLDQATEKLMRAVKQRIVKQEGRVDYDKLRKSGYSDRFLSRMEQA